MAPSVDRRVRTAALDEAEHGAGRPVDDGERVGVGRPERDAGSRMILSRPDDSRGCALELRVGVRCPQRLGPEGRFVALGQRSLVCRGAHVAGEHARARVIEDRRLRPPAQELVRLAHEELVERVLGGDEHREPVAAAPGAPPLLTQRGDRAGKADGDDRVEQSDVDPELERVRRRDAEQLPGGEPPLDLPPLGRGVAGAIRREEPVVSEPLGSESVNQLRSLAALGEGQRAEPPVDEHRLEARGLAERRRPEAELSVEQRRVPEHDRALGARGRVVADHGHRLAEQGRAELSGVRDRRRREHEPRLGAVDVREPPQPPQDVRDVGAEHAAVDVGLVDDHVAEIREHVAPAVVVRQEPDVDHVGVGEDHVRPRADLPALLGRSVAVVDRRPEPGGVQRGERAELILRERLGRVQVERAALRLPRHLVEHGEVEGQRLAGGGAGRHEHVLAAPGRIPDGPLVRVEPRDPDGGPHPWVELVRERGRPSLARGLGDQVSQLLALEQPLPAQDVDAHLADASLALPGCSERG